MEKGKRPRRFSKKGDAGYASILGKRSDPINRYRVPKYHPRPQAYGTVDEASAALSLARQMSQTQKVRDIIYSLQKDLILLMAELATAPEAYEESPFKVTRKHVRRLERLIEELQADVVRKVVESPEIHESIYPKALCPSDDLLKDAEQNRRAVLDNFSLDQYGKRLLEVYHRNLEGEPGPLEALSADILLEKFLSPDRFTLLRT